jgi:hypothetical protein
MAISKQEMRAARGVDFGRDFFQFGFRAFDKANTGL